MRRYVQGVWGVVFLLSSVTAAAQPSGAQSTGAGAPGAVQPEPQPAGAEQPATEPAGDAAPTADAEAGNAAAAEKIKQAISVHYLATQFEQAEKTLLEVPQDCVAAKCSPAIIAKAWMYVGLVRIVGNGDSEGARAAFVRAIKIFPATQLDPDLQTPEAQHLWSAAHDKQSGDRAVLGGMQCTPEVREVQTRRPIPIACSTDQPATRAEIKYREFGSTHWKSVQMGSAGGKWLGTIPCSATDLQGKLSWYVNALDQSGELIDNYGAQRQPIEMQLVETTTQPPPAYPEQDPPVRCGSAGECPTEMLGTPACPGTVKPDPTRGNKDVGEQCEQTAQCTTGLDCVDGKCEPPKSCETDTDCEHGRCVDLLCTVEDEAAKEGPLNWLGLHFAADLALVSGDNVCTNSDFACFYKNGDVVGSTGATFGGANTSPGNVQSGFALGTMRVLASYERLLLPNVGIEGRLGFAFNGASSGKGVSFLPLHLEARGKYWLLGAPAQEPVSPYVHFGVGLGQVDAKVSVLIAQDCSNATGSCSPTPEIDAYQQMGVGFITLGGGALIAVGPNYGINLNLNAQYMLPKSGLVVQPSLGFEYGF
jgi:hypothetical protein